MLCAMLLVAVPTDSSCCCCCCCICHASCHSGFLLLSPFNSFDAPRVVKAFLTHDLPTLRKHCGPELMERLEGIFKHFEAQVCHNRCYNMC
jgi:hypothetical protein